MTETEDYAEVTAPEAHATSHEDGGSDEINVAALSGELGDEQKSAWTKVSGKPTTFSPSAHKASHQDGGSDEIDAAGLSGRINYVDRGDPAGWDFRVGDFTTDQVWRDLDLSGIVPAGARAVNCSLSIQDNLTAKSVILRKNGNTSAYNTLTARTQVSNIINDQVGVVACDQNRKVEYWASLTTWTSIDLIVLGWFI